MKDIRTQSLNAVIFDLDGTLIEDEGVMRRITEKGHELDSAQVSKSTSKLSRVPALGGRRLLERLARRYTNQNMIEGSREVLEFLKDNDVDVFVVSLGDQDIVRDIVAKNFGDLIDIDKVYGSATGKLLKPEPSAYTSPLYEHAIDFADPSSVVVVGNTVSTDLVPALNNGMKAIHFNQVSRDTGKGVKEEIDSVSSMSELKSVLSAMIGKTVPASEAAPRDSFVNRVSMQDSSNVCVLR